MCRRILCLSLALIYTFTIACTDVHHVVRGEIKPEKDHILDVVTTSGKVVTFDKHGGELDAERQIIRGDLKDGGYVEIPVAEVVSARVKRGDAGETVMAIFGIAFLVVGVLFIIAVATKESCPFVYSFDGVQFVFDAEPLGGAVSKGLERADLSRLEHLRAVDGTYRLLMRNEVEETQYLNEMRLLVVDHPAGTDVHGDLTGTLHVVDDPVAPETAVNEDGIDLRPMLAAPDDILWQTNLQAIAANADTTLRHTYTFTFKKPPAARDGFLIVKSGTALWGSHMIREMLQLRGDGLDAWYRSIDTGGSAMQELTDFNVREELYFLKLYVLEDGQWVHRAWIPAGGPLHTESRIIPLDLSGVHGDDVKLRVYPPKGFWTFDYLAMEFDHHPAPAVTPVPLSRAVDSTRGDVTASLAARDDARYEMPLVGDSAVLEFA
ncbi:MAG TPA: hypothetical protein VFU38_10125, partial [Candidatus Krumholzibacteria bacterium]|nr:hypothetical protein [Candidatus Krumholzibacteria bacterium]